MKNYLSTYDMTWIGGNAAVAVVATDLTSTLLTPGVVIALLTLLSTFATIGFNLYKARRAPEVSEAELMLQSVNKLVEQLNRAQQQTGNLATQRQIVAAKETAVVLEQQLTSGAPVTGKS